MRVSNFLLWQIAYSEIWVTDKLWPDFQTTDLLESILDFQRRERRYGGLGRAAPDSEPALVGAGLTHSAADADAAEGSTSSLNKYSRMKRVLTALLLIPAVYLLIFFAPPSWCAARWRWRRCCACASFFC